MEYSVGRGVFSHPKMGLTGQDKVTPLRKAASTPVARHTQRNRRCTAVAIKYEVDSELCMFPPLGQIDQIDHDLDHLDPNLPL